MKEPTDKYNPWELKVIGIFFIFAGIMWLFQDGTEIVSHYSSGGGTGRSPMPYNEVQTPAIARVYGLIALVLGCICLRVYSKLRKGPPKGKGRK
jgi:drug/metabolite transporter (DMT)-like permease